MKYKASKRDINASYDVYKVGYCTIQYLLNGIEPFAYSARAEGWACDYYDLGGNIVISTGYAPTGTAVPYELSKKYDDKAAKVLENKWAWKRQQAELAKLRAEYVKEVIA